MASRRTPLRCLLVRTVRRRGWHERQCTLVTGVGLTDIALEDGTVRCPSYQTVRGGVNIQFISTIQFVPDCICDATSPYLAVRVQQRLSPHLSPMGWTSQKYTPVGRDGTAHNRAHRKHVKGDVSRLHKRPNSIHHPIARTESRHIDRRSGHRYQ